MEQLPIYLNLSDQPCLVVGGGVVAERKARLLLRAGATVTVVAPEISPAIRSLEPARVLLCEVPFAASAVAGQRLVIAASDDDAVNRAVADAAAAAGTWCNVVDNPALSTFFVPAIVDRSPVVVAIGTGGTAPVLAQRLKSAIEAFLPAGIGELAAQAGRWRELVKKRFAGGDERRRFWQALFAGPIARDLLAGRRRDAERAFRAAMLAPVVEDAAPAPAGEAWLVGAGPGDPELITLRGQRLLAEADVVMYDALVSPVILDYARKDATLVAVGKRSGGPDTQDAINEELVRRVRAGERVCRLKGGDPYIFGRGGEEVAALAAAGLPYRVVPGISAATGCAASAGFPLTHRGLANSVTLATAMVGKSDDPDWASLARPGRTLALYMAVNSLEQVTAKLVTHGLPPSTPAAVVENGTRDDQRVVDGTLANIAARAREAAVASPATLFVGEVVGLRAAALPESAASPLPRRVVAQPLPERSVS